MDEHPVEQPITTLIVDHQGNVFRVGVDGVTRIEACAKSGPHSYVPYIRVWASDFCLAEFCQHNIVGVYFS